MTNVDLITLICLLVYLPATLLIHRTWYRLKPTLKQAHAQGPAIKVVAAVATGSLVFLAVALPRDTEYLSHMAFALLALTSLGAFYFSFLCVSESGRRYYMLALLAANQVGLSRDELATRYSKDYMIDVRLARLLAWHVIEEREGKLILSKWSFYASSAFCYYWAKLLCFNWFDSVNSGRIV